MNLLKSGKLDLEKKRATADRIATESNEVRQTRLGKKKRATADRIATESNEDRQSRLGKEKRATADRVANETPNSRVTRLNSKRIATANNIISENIKQKDKRLTKIREGIHLKRNIINIKKRKKWTSDSSIKITAKTRKKASNKNRKSNKSSNNDSDETNWISDNVLCSHQLPNNSAIINSFERDPRAAVLVYHIQSGLLHELEAPQKDVENLCTDNLSDNDKTSFLFNAVDKFNKAIGQEEKYVCCASCGVINRSSECSLIQLGDEKLDHLLVNDEFSNWWKQLHPVYQAAHNVTEFKEIKIYATAYI